MHDRAHRRKHVADTKWFGTQRPPGQKRRAAGHSLLGEGCHPRHALPLCLVCSHLLNRNESSTHSTRAMRAIRFTLCARCRCVTAVATLSGTASRSDAPLLTCFQCSLLPSGHQSLPSLSDQACSCSRCRRRGCRASRGSGYRSGGSSGGSSSSAHDACRSAPATSRRSTPLRGSRAVETEPVTLWDNGKSNAAWMKPSVAPVAQHERLAHASVLTHGALLILIHFITAVIVVVVITNRCTCCVC